MSLSYMKIVMFKLCWKKHDYISNIVYGRRLQTGPRSVNKPNQSRHGGIWRFN